ncbi:MAG: potassium channel protein [Aquificaceae bacterium]|nr:potassium channel protein [Aquificaceae bacterium]MCS7307057.1 potassium channel protein [Aquificaceae bacterium]MCX8076193.1 potassium channel protein [Aquificaceae bacterium]MDW8433887.1 potassium channel protein [Aquificaceae bacterium]
MPALSRLKKLRKPLKKLRLRKKREKTLLEAYQNRLIESLKELRIPLLLLHFSLSVGTIGYMILSGGNFIDSIYMTVITIGTIGFGEIAKGSETPMGRIFTTFLSLMGIGVFTTSVTVVVRVFLVGDLVNLVKYIRMLSSIEKLRDHVIICGYNRTSAWLIEPLKKRKLEFVVIDHREEAIKYIQMHNIKYFIPEEPYKKTALTSAGIERARYLIANMESEAENIAVIVTARLLRPNKEDLLIYSTAPTDGSAKKLEELGANKVIVPDKLVANRVFSYMLHETRGFVSDLFDRIAYGEEAELEIVELKVREGSPIVGKFLKDLDLRKTYGVTVIGIRKEGGALELTISGDTKIEDGDTLLILGKPVSVKKAVEFYKEVLR